MAPIDKRVLRTHASEARDTALIDTAASVVAALIIAHARGDAEAAAGELARLLQAVAKFTNSLDARPGDAALNRALEYTHL